MVAQQDPVARALKRMQRDGINVGKSVEIWLDLLKDFPASAPLSIVKKRAEYALETPFFLAANCLDPRYQGT